MNTWVGIFAQYESSSLLVMIGVGFGQQLPGAQSVPEVALILGSASVALVQGLTPVAMGQNSTLLTQGTRTPFLSCFYFNRFPLYSPTSYVVSLIIHFEPACTVSASVINVFFTGGRDPLENSL